MLINNIQTVIDPEVNHAEGLGLAPIGHEVTITAVRTVLVDVAITIYYESGYRYEMIKSYIEKAVEEYLLELRKSWERSREGLVVRRSHIESAILEVQGVLDVMDTHLNGAEVNIHLGADEIPIRGEIVGQAAN